MLRPWIWITATLAPILIFVSLLFACRYIVANAVQLSPVSADISTLSTNLNADQVTIQSSSLMTSAFDAILVQSVYPSDGVFPSGQVVYTLRISHTNVSAVSNLILTSTVSSGFIPDDSFAVGATVTQLTTYPTYTWRIDNLQSGGQAIVYIVGNLDPTQNISGTLTNFSTLAVPQDSNPTNNSVQHSLPISVPQIALDSYTIDVNEGNSDAAIDITLDIPNPYGPAMIDYETINESGVTGAISNLDYVPISGTITISAARTSQRFFVEILDDSIDENLESIKVLLSNPRGVTIGSASTLSVTIVDNDGAGVLVDPLQLDLFEGGPVQVFSITLTSQPLSPVNIVLDENSDTIFSSNVITFTTGNWNTPQIMSVRAVDNYIDDNDRSTVIVNQANSQDPVYHNRSISDVIINIIDDDDAKIIITPTTAISLTEGIVTGTNNTDTYTLVLNSEPVAPVNIAVHPDSQLQTDTNGITFTVQNWNVPQIVTVEVMDDLVAEGTHSGIISHIVNSEDETYASAEAGDVSIIIEDDDSATMLFSTDNLTLLEGSDSGLYSVTLTSRPLHTVSVSALINDALLTVLPNNLLFSPENWNIPQAISVTAVDNRAIDELSSVRIEHQLSSDDPMYGAITGDVFVNIEDDDSAGIFIETSILTIREGVISSSQPSLVGTNIYDITLISQPTEAVTVTLITAELLTTTPEQLIFEPEDWDQHQTVFITVPDDNEFQGNQLYTITHQLSSEDLNYNIITNELVAKVIDNDEANIEIGDNSNMILREGLDSNDYTITLSSMPSSAVTITLSTNEQLSAMPDLIVFTAQNWSEPQKVSLTPTDDDDAEDNQTGVVTYGVSSADKFYDNLEIDMFEVPIIDDDQGSSIYIPIMQR